MSSRTQRNIGIVLTIVSLCALAVSAWDMQKRLGSRTDLKDRPVVWFDDPIQEESFKFRGVDCEVRTIEQDGKPLIKVHWRGQVVRFEIGGRDDPRLPKLLRHSDWFRVLAMAEGRTSTQADLLQKLDSGAVQPRLIIAGRYPAEGFNPQTWGLVRRRDWRYRFVELLVEGPPEQSVVEHATTYRTIERIVAPGPRDKPVEGLTAADMEAALWQYSAMLQVTPAPLYRAKDKVVEGGMRAMGWTWPVAGLAVMGLVAGLGLTAASRIGRSTSAE